ncbi:hypothetical protein [Natranaeroarchaeum aerophilus]|uniref:Uncharacterized protein n=1 Tax=Natranaeroarchaeum aerophilus TaxID=2917711 RepID=A0AAE3K2L3_9EURY|nr:hypothetical protein [Natranaeroarchaeum aerophilus]MCL9812052.1 hypothetical protein [Natranaeroarchaeum aerophilus]
MEATIPTEDEQYIAVDVVDNKGIEHNLTLEKQGGQIEYHEQDGYPDDPVERTNSENLHTNNARAYAQYYAAATRGYDTVEEGIHPDRVAMTMLVLADLSPEQLGEYFSTLHQQAASHHTDLEPVFDLPEEIPAGASVQYNQDVYLGLDRDDQQALVDAVGDEDATILEYLDDVEQLATDGGSVAATQNGFEAIRSVAEEHDVPELLDSFDTDRLIQDVSGVHTVWLYHDGINERRGEEADVEGTADAILQVIPNDCETLAEFKEFLIHHLVCQVRDCYIRMGLTPPEPVQVTGPGLTVETVRYQGMDILQDIHDHEASIDWDTVTDY